MKYLALLCGFLISACASEPAPKVTESNPDMSGISSDQQIKEDALSIEQAAEEAVKLIEAEAKAEADGKIADSAKQ